MVLRSTSWWHIWICSPGLHSWATRLRTSTAAGHCWMNSSQKELSSRSWAITRHALTKNKQKHQHHIISHNDAPVLRGLHFKYKIVSPYNANMRLRLVKFKSWFQIQNPRNFDTDLTNQTKCTSLPALLFTHLVLISASKRTAAITGLEPSPVAGKEVWIERLPSCGRSIDCTACTTFSVIDSL